MWDAFTAITVVAILHICSKRRSYLKKNISERGSQIFFLIRRLRVKTGETIIGVDPYMFHIQYSLVQFEEEKPKLSETTITDNQSMEIDVVGEAQEIDPDDDMAGLMREMNDSANVKPTFGNESLNSETSTDTAFSLSAQMSDRDDFATV